MSEKEYFYEKKRNLEVIKHFDPEVLEAFRTFDKLSQADGELNRKTKQLIAVACAHMTRCPYCISGHTKMALKLGATKKELAEAIAVAAALSAGAPLAHSRFSLSEDI